MTNQILTNPKVGEPVDVALKIARSEGEEQ